MKWVDILLFGSVFLFAIGVLYGLYYASRTGQFTKLEEGSKSIFDADEPIGRQTDVFPKKETQEL